MRIKYFATIKLGLLLTAVFFTLTSMVPGRANFSGRWKLNEFKSDRGHSTCTWGLGDHMRSTTMKVVAQTNFLTIYVVDLSAGVSQITTQEKLTFDGKEREDTICGRPKKSTVMWSPDRQTMTVNCILTCGADSQKVEYKVTEVWKLINDGKSISLQANIKSTYGEDVMNLVFDKAS